MEHTGALTGPEVRTLRVKTGISLHAMAVGIGCPREELAELELSDAPVPDGIAAGVAKVVTQWIDEGRDNE